MEGSRWAKLETAADLMGKQAEATKSLGKGRSNGGAECETELYAGHGYYCEQIKGDCRTMEPMHVIESVVNDSGGRKGVTDVRSVVVSKWPSKDQSW